MRPSVLIIVFLLFISCGNKPVHEKADTSKTEVLYVPDTIAAYSMSIADSAGAFFIDSLIGEYQLDTTFIPRYKRKYDGLLLLTRGYHGDEILDVMKNASWMELYRKEGKAYLQNSKVKFETFFDGIVDEDSSEMTGVDVSSEHEDAIFIANLNGLKQADVSLIELDTNVVLPGSNIMFEFNGAHYRFYASAYYHIKEDRKDPDYIANYKLYLERDSAGVKTTQLVMARPFYAGLYLIGSFFFVGDIDRDGKPDFVLETSNNYNGSNPTLFLSSYAKPGELVKAVAYHSSVGC
ncbi:MAG: hypothetical protein H6551_10140 [Chitinophagales bacterium]|nr:hypothetical protein [Chitinophagaceae bacterium]MCB9065486.1 hypothetical protein [Chitinophagales bacterium]